jgi:hypothetical protein
MREGFMQFFSFSGAALPERVGAESKPGPVHYTNMRVTLGQRHTKRSQDIWNRFQSPLAAT